MHQCKGNPIKWKLSVNKANLNLSWMLLSSIPAGAMFSEWFRGASMIITSAFTYPFVNAPGLAILSTVFVRLMDIDLHFKRNVYWAWFKHTGAPRSSSNLYLIVSCHAATDFPVHWLGSHEMAHFFFEQRICVCLLKRIVMQASKLVSRILHTYQASVCLLSISGYRQGHVMNGWDREPVCLSVYKPRIAISGKPAVGSF